MSDKRSVATDALETLGTAPLDDTAKRDAIHLAVEPAIAGVLLRAGDHVVIQDGRAYLASVGMGIGVVDPFIQCLLRPGDRFWLVLYPRTIKSLRHVWSHPAFPEEPGVATAADPDKAASERWLREFIATADCPGYEQVMGAVSDLADGNNGSWDEEYLHFDEGSAHGDIPPEFWTHAEIVLGRKIDKRPPYFSCSC